MKKMYLIILQGGGGTDIKLVPYAAKAWIESAYPANMEETIPADVKEGFEDYYEEDTLLVTPGSGDNDRALVVQGYGFNSTTDAHKYARKNDIEIVDEYHGYIY